jgi:hypothetical protein
MLAGPSDFHVKESIPRPILKANQISRKLATFAEQIPQLNTLTTVSQLPFPIRGAVL